MQFLYGEDGMEGTAIEGQRMEFLRYNSKKFEDVRRPAAPPPQAQGHPRPQLHRMRPC